MKARFRLAYAFALGLIAGLIIYSLSSRVGPGGRPAEVSHLYGTIAGQEGRQLRRLEAVSIDLPEVVGRIELMQSGSLLVVQPDLRAGAQLDFVMEFDPSEIRFEGFGSPDRLDLRIVVGDGSVTARDAGEGRYVLSIAEQGVGGARLGIKVLLSGALVYEHAFVVPERD